MPHPRHWPSPADLSFLHQFEAGQVEPAAFGHRAHIRLAYVLLTRHDVDAAHARLRGLLRATLRAHGVDEARYHETMTRAWVLAVAHFMSRSDSTDSFEAFVAGASALLDKAILETHYTQSRLFSDEARSRFVEPDLDPLPVT